MLALPALLFALLHTFLSLILWPRSEKWILTFLYVVSSAVLYAQMSYRVVFDYTMIQNVFETDASDPLCDGDYCFDEILLVRLNAKLTQPANRDILIVLHQIGPHGPTYYRRYPDTYRLYTPDCPRSDIQNCSTEALVNTYDNTIAYSDYVNAKVIELVDTAEYDATVMYISDHGESLGEGGVYLHGLPYSFAPKTQTRVPIWVWTNHHPQVLKNCLAPFTEPTLASHDNVFHTLIGMMGISSTAVRPELDMTSHCGELAAF
jgi:lipid A ethanolaminephosphotransferase